MFSSVMTASQRSTCELLSSDTTLLTATDKVHTIKDNITILRTHSEGPKEGWSKQKIASRGKGILHKCQDQAKLYLLSL